MNYYELIKEELISNEIFGQVKDYSKNRHDLETRYDVGKLLYKAGKHYGERITKEYSIKLTSELGKGYDATSLKRMRQFYLLIEKGATMSHQLSWSHWIELLPCDDLNKISYYIKLIEKQDIGQIEIYMNYINTNLKKVYHGKTIGIILCKKDNKFIIEYSSDKRILSREYLLN